MITVAFSCSSSLRSVFLFSILPWSLKEYNDERAVFTFISDSRELRVEFEEQSGEFQCFSVVVVVVVVVVCCCLLS